MPPFRQTCAFRKYSVPEMLPFLLLMARRERLLSTLSLTEFLTLILVDILSRTRGWATISSLTEILCFKKPSVLGIVARLKKKGLIENKGNQNFLRLFVTKKGEDVFNSYSKFYVSKVEWLLKHGIDFRKL